MVLTKQAVNTSAVVLQPPEELTHQIQEIRKTHDRTFQRWPPHINLLYPFVPRSEFDIVTNMLQAPLEGIKPFTITLSRIDAFVGSEQVVIYAVPEGPIAELQAALQKAVPWCSKQSKKTNGFVPHLTLGRAPLAQYEQLKASLSATWQPISWEVKAVDLLVRSESDNSEPFRCIGSLKFGEAPASEVPVSQPRMPTNAKNAHYSMLPTYAYTGERWAASSAGWSDYQAPSLRVATYNVLMDFYEKDKIFSKQRFPHLSAVLERCEADVIGLQEVAAPFLTFLLKQSWVRSYYLSDIGKSGTVSPYGQLIMCKFPFKTVVAQFSKMKRIVIGEAKINHRRVYIPVVHLTSSHQGDGSETLEKRVKQMELAYRRASPDPQDPATDCLLMGDFNLHDGDDGEQDIIRAEFLDCWRTLQPGDPGYTFDPKNNTLAKLNSNRGLCTRFDRILFFGGPLTPQVRSSVWHPAQVSIFGKDSFTHEANSVQHLLFPSDHYGLLAVLDLKRPEQTVPEPEPQPAPQPEVAVDGAALGRGVLMRLLPALDPRAADQALLRLTEFVNSLFKTDPVRLYTVGSYRLGVSSPGSDIDVVVVAAMDRRLFFREFKKAARNNPAIHVTNIIEDALVPIITVEIDRIPFDVQFCPLPATTDFARLDTRGMDVKTVMTFSSILDTEILLRAIPNLGNFRLAMRAVKQWAKQRGLYSNQFGFFGGFGWSVLMTSIAEKYPKATPEELLFRFFVDFAAFNWERGIVTLQCNQEAVFKRDREADKLVVLTLTKPYKNSARNATAGTRRILIRELGRAADLLRSASPPPWADLLAPTPFPTQYKQYVLMNLTARDLREFRSWLGYFQSRLVMLLIKLERCGVAMHVSPQPYVALGESWPFTCLFLAGVRVLDSQASSQDQFTAAIQEFDSLLDGWPGRTPGMFLEITQRGADHLPQLIPAPALSDDLEEQMEEVAGADPEPDAEPSSSPSPSPSPSSSSANGAKKPPAGKDKKKGGKGKGAVAEDDEPNKKKRSRTSEDIYNRIKWDPSLDKQSCMIGYLDRFIGEQEMLFENWRKNPLDLIPWHRVLYFKINGEIVWDRRTRLDKLTEQ